MAKVRNIAGEAREVRLPEFDFVHLFEPGEKLEVPDEYFRYRTWDSVNFEVTGKPSFAAKTVEELREEEAAAKAEQEAAAEPEPAADGAEPVAE